MLVLVIYNKFRLRDRRTITDHLYALRRYLPSCRFIYLDMSSPKALTKAVMQAPYDAVIYHYTFMAKRFEGASFDHLLDRVGEKLAGLSGVKAMMLHDEYIFTEAIWRVVQDCRIDLIFASCGPQDYDVLFPAEKTGRTPVVRTVFTGYVDENLTKKIQRQIRRKKPASRPYDIVYRAMRANYIFGHHGQVKTDVAQAFQRELIQYPGLRTNILLAHSGYVNTLYGNKWIRFLCSSRTTLGCLGGSSLMDACGMVQSATLAYVAEHPDASYQEVSEHCYSGQDGVIQSRLLGPRHFECAMTKTCQVMVEGDYQGVLTPWIDFIPIKSDYSDIPEILALIQDTDYCAQIAENCYHHVVESGRYTYRVFANQVLEELQKVIQDKQAGQKQQVYPSVKLLWLRLSLSVRNRFSLVILKRMHLDFWGRMEARYPELFHRLVRLYHKLPGKG